MDYIRRMMAYSDQVHILDFAKKKSMEEGRKEGLEKGRLESVNAARRTLYTR